MTRRGALRRLHDDYELITLYLRELEIGSDVITMRTRSHYEEVLAKTAALLLDLIRAESNRQDPNKGLDG